MNFIKSIIPIREDFSLGSLLSFEKNPMNIFLAVLIAGLFAIFAAGLYLFFTESHSAYNVYRQHPWGLLIAMYVFFVVSSTGLCIISSFGHVFGIKEFEVISKRAILGAIVTILSGFAVIVFEVGHPITMVIYNILTPNFTSAIWWMGTLYGAYLVAIILEFIFLLRDDHKWSKIFGAAGLVVGIAAHSNLGAVFGFLVARPISNGVFFPIYFILSAMITGAYILFILYGHRYKFDFSQAPDVKLMLERLAKVLTVLLAILLFFEIWRFLTSLYGGVPERANTSIHILQSPSFVIGEVILGMLIPLLTIVFTKGKNLAAISYASVIGMVGIFTMRYNLAHDTQVFPMQTLKLNEYQLPPSFVAYFPSFAEIAIGLGGFAICFSLYYLANKLFDLGR